MSIKWCTDAHKRCHNCIGFSINTWKHLVLSVVKPSERSTGISHNRRDITALICTVFADENVVHYFTSIANKLNKLVTNRISDSLFIQLMNFQFYSTLCLFIKFLISWDILLTQNSFNLFSVSFASFLSIVVGAMNSPLNPHINELKWSYPNWVSFITWDFFPKFFKNV